MSVLAPERPAAVPASPPPAPAPLRLERVAALLFSLAVVVYTFVQAPGRIVADTKLDLALSPAQFLGRALHLWDSQAGFGHIQNQAPGYLFPMGPFFALTHALHVPTWVAQRVWISGLLLLAFWGALKVAEALRVGTPWTRLVAAAAYALSPAMLSLIAVTSGNQLPAVFLPWALLPLVRHSPGKRASRAAGLSALAIAAMGGINGMATVAVLLMPFLWLLTRPPGRVRRRLIAWWIPCVGLATLWWTAPLVLQGRYGFHFLQFTESPSVTTGTSSIVETVRGTGYWVSYLHVTGPWLRGAWDLVASPLVILASALLAAAGLYGLARKDLPQRRFLALTALVGVAVLTAGYAGPLASPLSPAIRSLLNGALSPARNLNKFEPIVRLALALALGHALLVLDVSTFVRRVGAAFLLVAVAATPLWQGHLAADGSFTGVPAYWRQAARWLGTRASDGRTLIVPSAAFGEYAWGRPLDEPMQALAKSDWVVRDIVPLGSTGATRLLDAVERPLELGEPSPDLTPFLARAGIHYLLLRNDLDPLRSGAPASAYLRRSLDGTPGLVRVRSFGPRVQHVMTSDRLTPDLGASVGGDVRSLEVYEVYGASPTIAAYPRAGTMTADGAPDSLLQLGDPAALTDEAAGLSGDPLGPPTAGGLHVQSDAVQRRDDQFGWVRNDLSYPLTPTERAAGADQKPQQRLVVDGPNAETSAHLTGAVDLAASSYEGPFARLPERQPYAAFDGDPSTAWVTGSSGVPIGQWIQLKVAKPISPPTLEVQLLLDRPLRPRITALTLTTQAGSVTDPVLGTEAPQTLTLPRGKTTWIRLTIAAVNGFTGAPGLREVRIQGVDVARTLGLPSPPARSTAQQVQLARQHADPYDFTRSDEETRLDRSFSLPVPADLRLTGTVRPVPGVALDEVLASTQAPASLQVAPSSTWKDIPAFAPRSMIDGDPSTSWLASPDDRQPSIQLSWPVDRTLDSIQVTPPDGPAIRPVKLRLQSGLAIRDVDVASGDVVPFEALHTNSVTITFLDAAPTQAGERTPGFLTQLPVGIAELRFPALDDLRPRPIGANAAFALPCGAGPAVTVDGTAIPTSVRGTLGDLQTLAPLEVQACGPISLGAGPHHLVAGPDRGLVLTTATLTTPPPSTLGLARSVTAVGTWGAEARRVRIGPGVASYLALTENFNEGWTATLDGHHLRAVRLDGWRQAWLVPAGAGGVVHLSFPAGHVYRWSLAAGALGALIVLALVAIPRRRRAPAGVGEEEITRRRVHRVPWVVQAAAAVAFGFVLAGAVGVVVAIVLLWLARSRLPLIAGVAFAVAGVAVFLSPGRFPGSDSGAFGAPAQLFAVVAVIATAVSLVRERARHGA